MEAYLLDWANLLLRWVHLIAGVAWIGASFYFVMLDNSLQPPKKREDAARGVHGELGAVHGGGFYCSQKFLTGPQGEPLADDLHWSKWEAYTTWLSGMGMLALIYWIGASSYLIDSKVMALSPPAAIGISIGVLVLGWVAYDVLCRNMIGRDGAMLGTMMAANVFFHIIPGQKRMVAQIRSGQPVETLPGIVGKQRSVHNTYFTLPVLFIMISNHYPMTYANKHGWLVLAVLMLAGVLIRQFFMLRHRGQVKWWLPAAGVALIALLMVLMAPKAVDASGARVGFTAIR